MSLSRLISRSFDAALETAFPSQCAGCGEAVVGSRFSGVCGACVPRLQLIEDPKCLTCGFPFFGDTESHTHCMHCEHLQPAFGQGWSIALFRGPVRELIYALKYKGGLWALRDIRELGRRAPGLTGFAAGATLVPVPLHPRKLRERGYNQSELLARELLEILPDCRLEALLERCVDTVSQTQFDRKQRIRNLKNAFSLRQKRAIDPAQRYIIVDDVFTTGSTVNACAAALRRAGARAIDVLTIGHG
ncbi:double zinc ribbon domain-containing protein [Pelagicoccus sp. SDUM812005]|uniref:double zinc ribbon domain-containing protein n=1 Tax=Pelagicoccus sp. SDUM812005 TaxID=3041257 RepID=UPI0028104DF8|nr:double zinc ribbon domain-containing protein [Pelagicoccus sp. SDUM812005]MDQ8179831.1 double zinc ribbon domain-containing protein [Pelagicoccus sp. SDUM812005]